MIQILLMTLAALFLFLQDPNPEIPKSTDKVESSSGDEAPNQKAEAPYKEVDPESTIGQPVPAVEVTDLEGGIVDLSELSDKTMVLEFTLPSCRFAQRLYIQQRVQPMIRRLDRDEIQWYSIDSSFFAHPQRWRDWAQKYSLKHQFLLDKEGRLAEALGVKVSPTFIIIHKGKIAYHGSLDDDIWGQDLERKVLLDDALKACLGGEKIEKPYEKPYGMAIRTRRVEDLRRKEFEEARKKALGDFKKPSDQ
ncbi:MAG: hypothetical protein CBC13_03945 [Planctomycetia bacterium TMED53]|nr:MAG: hypothetical protein CBC13_03945 [Planctomycetia bacterium TMED53]